MIKNLTNEIWKDIKGYEGLYQISNIGRVKSHPRIKGCIYHKEKILSPHDNGNGYLCVDLYGGNNNRRKYYIHRLVAEMFIQNPNDYPIVNHKDENRKNNIVANLEWCTYKYNLNYGNVRYKMSKAHRGKPKPLPTIMVVDGKEYTRTSVICLTTGEVFKTIKEAAKYYNIENLRSHISRMCKGTRQYSYLGTLPDKTPLKWMYYVDYIKQKENSA